MAELENIRDWRGEDVIDADSEKIGKLDDVYFDTDTDEPMFAAVKTGLLGRHITFIPLAGASVSRDHVRVDYGKEDVKDAPTIDNDGELSEAEEERLYRYYGMEYAPSSQHGGRRLARR